MPHPEDNYFPRTAPAVDARVGAWLGTGAISHGVTYAGGFLTRGVLPVISEEQIIQLFGSPFEGADLPLPGKQAGKVREWYNLPGQRRLLVTTDRLSASNRILACVP
jgi:hypothetical protein